MSDCKQIASWSSGNLIFGSTNVGEVLGFHGDTLRIPSVRGRADLTYTGDTTGGVCYTLANPTTQTLWVEKAIIHCLVPSSSGSLSVGIAAISGSSATEILSASTEALAAVGYIGIGSSGVLPVAWTSTEYLTAYVTSATGVVPGGTAAYASGTVSVFYITAVVT
jgi:hypothetical protein